MNTMINNFFIAGLLLTCVVGYDIQHSKPTKVEVYAEAPKEIVEAIVVVQEPSVEEYITQVFGEDAPKALLLLKGKGEGTCAENKTLNKEAVNRNWTKTPGVYWSSDWSIFQINDKFHPVKELNLDTDWKANVDYAHTLFHRDGSFHAWVCGKYWGI